MIDIAALLWGMLFSAIGFGFFSYGRKQRNGAFLAVGITLMAYPYFVSDVYILVALGTFLAFTPFLLKRLG